MLKFGKQSPLAKASPCLAKARLWEGAGKKKFFINYNKYILSIKINNNKVKKE